jgi:hypothetical protein
MKIEDVLPEKFQTLGFQDLFVSSTVVDPGGGAGGCSPLLSPLNGAAASPS